MLHGWCGKGFENILKIDIAEDSYKKGPFRLYHLKSESYIEAGSVFYPKYYLNEYIVPKFLVDVFKLVFMKHMQSFKVIFWLRNIIPLVQNKEDFECRFPGKGLRRLSWCC